MNIELNLPSIHTSQVKATFVLSCQVPTSGGTNLVTKPPSCLCSSLRKGERAPGGGAAKPLLGADWRCWEGGELRGEILDTGAVHYLIYLTLS